eukprot:NODE_262_length_2367_cov_17.201467_g207_i0.p1 GENE.NODE_262_length_2367_cov_17.201467_g207_i0~~NODE_262_length_2367_cov_17.201467_g207_i0.p1  ORF type:complete len:544 (-),score=91.92 NODE_262_length_2367_cov_17.201467_g207_i0:736-2367(-)
MVNSGDPYKAFIVRLTANGATDTSFGMSGHLEVTNPLGAPGDSSFNALVQDPSGKVVAMGVAMGPSGTMDAFAHRYADDGSMDTGFGTSGTFSANGINYGLHEQFTAGTLQTFTNGYERNGGAMPNVYVVGVGTATSPAGDPDVFVMRWLYDPLADTLTMDGSFGPGGYIIQGGFSSRGCTHCRSFDYATSASSSPRDGDIMVAGYTHDEALSRNTTDGLLFRVHEPDWMPCGAPGRLRFEKLWSGLAAFPHHTENHGWDCGFTTSAHPHSVKCLCQASAYQCPTSTPTPYHNPMFVKSLGNRTDVGQSTASEDRVQAVAYDSVFGALWVGGTHSQATDWGCGPAAAVTPSNSDAILLRFDPTNATCLVQVEPSASPSTQTHRYSRLAARNDGMLATAGYAFNNAEGIARRFVWAVLYNPSGGLEQSFSTISTGFAEAVDLLVLPANELYLLGTFTGTLTLPASTAAATGIFVTKLSTSLASIGGFVLDSSGPDFGGIVEASTIRCFFVTDGCSCVFRRCACWEKQRGHFCARLLLGISRCGS